jgi:hypothetical protein
VWQVRGGLYTAGGNYNEIGHLVAAYYARSIDRHGLFHVVPLDEVDEILAAERIDIAININSFPECRPEAVEWWVSRTARWRIKHFLVSCMSDRLQTNRGLEFSSIFAKNGYHLRAREPKDRDALVQRYAIAPGYYFLFELLVRGGHRERRFAE